MARAMGMALRGRAIALATAVNMVTIEASENADLMRLKMGIVFPNYFLLVKISLIIGRLVTRLIVQLQD
jgi:nitrogen fixation/metabolism regulation signal transduction histidine kinase